jgi:site-specific DNA recombinase
MTTSDHRRQPSGTSQSASIKESEQERAVIYLRVSTSDQMNTAIDIDPDGNSIATQRDFCHRRATTVDAAVDGEFIEPGTSAQSIEKRPVFRQMLKHLSEHPEITHVIVYMRSRAFRNFTDAAMTKRHLAKIGVKLISAKEDFGEGYMADAMEGIVDIFNELESRRNGEDIKAKLRHKALNGGTVSRAKLGYLNTRAEHDGRLFNTICLDEERAPLTLRAFELYASGDYSIAQLEATMADLGLTTRASSRWPEQPVSTSKLHRMLADPYYAGWVSVDGELVPGRHEAIVSQALFDRVQDVLAVRSKGGARDRVLQHYLKGMLFCDRCDQAGRLSRLIYTEARGRNGQRYGYFLCRSRQEGICDLPHLPASQVEDAIERHYATLNLPDDFAAAVRAQLTETVDDDLQLTRDVQQQLTAQLAKLDVREERLIDLAADGLLSRTKIQERSNQIRLERTRVQRQLNNTSQELAIGAEHLRTCLDLARNPAALYRKAPAITRQHLNSTFYERFFLNDEPTRVTNEKRRPPFDEFPEAVSAYEKYKALVAMPTTKSKAPSGAAEPGTNENRRPGQGARSPVSKPTPVLAAIFPVSVSSKRVLVELRGFEPLTPCMPCRCATSCATAPLLPPTSGVTTRGILANGSAGCESGEGQGVATRL